MTPKWQKLASLAQEICTLWFEFFGAFFASKGYPFKNIIHCLLRPNRTSEKEQPVSVWYSGIVGIVKSIQTCTPI